MVEDESLAVRPRHNGSFQRFRGQTQKRRKADPDFEINKVVSKYPLINPVEIDTFHDLPLSAETAKGLSENGFIEPTDIQKQAIPLALRGCDVLGAAKTGSGKTLAFVVPLLECLWRAKWSRMCGLGGVVISPTRELALQTYETLQKVGHTHNLSIRYVIGGTDSNYEKQAIGQTNIIVCTPGRLLQHMDETPLFDCGDLQMLVLDEADRILDLGFEKQLNAVVENLPTTRQTLLFSATQTKSIKDLARLSLKDPVYVSVHEHSEFSTPAKLKQSFCVCEEEDKMNFLWSFIRNHLHSKTLVFFTNCKQVRFWYEAFRHMRPGTSISRLYGLMPLKKRLGVFQDFCRRESGALFATDIAARGLDFPAVDWVVQVDCPSDAEEYIHRCGRTARYQSGGHALLVLTSAQKESMLKKLAEIKVPITEIRADPSRMTSVHRKLQFLCAKFPELKTFAQRSFVAYIRSVFLFSDKNVFNIKKINLEALARSYGLPTAPRVRFLKKQGKHAATAQKRDSEATDLARMPPEIEAAGKTEHDDYGVAFDAGSSSSDEDDILKVKTQDVFGTSFSKNANIPTPSSKPKKKKQKVITKQAIAKKILRKKLAVNTRIVFDSEESDGGETVPSESNVSSKADFKANVEDGTDSEAVFDIEKARAQMQERDKSDRRNYRERMKAKRRELRQKRRKKMAERAGSQVSLPVQLGSGDLDEEVGDQEQEIEAEEIESVGGVSDVSTSFPVPEQYSDEGKAQLVNRGLEEGVSKFRKNASKNGIPKKKQRRLDKQTEWRPKKTLPSSLKEQEELALKLLQDAV